MTTTEKNNPWYKEFWAWFIFTPLMAIVGVMSILIYFAYSGRDSVVTDNYQKKGRMLEANFAPQNSASDLGLHGLLITINGMPYFLLSAKQAVFAPTISLYVEHPFEQALDTTVTFALVSDAQNQNPLFKQASTLLKNQTLPNNKQYIYSLKSDVTLSGKRYLRASYYSPSPVAGSDQKIEQWRLSGETHFDQSSYSFLTP